MPTYKAEIEINKDENNGEYGIQVFVPLQFANETIVRTNGPNNDPSHKTYEYEVQTTTGPTSATDYLLIPIGDANLNTDEDGCTHIRIVVNPPSGPQKTSEKSYSEHKSDE